MSIRKSKPLLLLLVFESSKADFDSNGGREKWTLTNAPGLRLYNSKIPEYMTTPEECRPEILKEVTKLVGDEEESERWELLGQIGNTSYGSQGAAIYSPEGVAYRKVVLQRLTLTDEQTIMQQFWQVVQKIFGSSVPDSETGIKVPRPARAFDQNSLGGNVMAALALALMFILGCDFGAFAVMDISNGICEGGKVPHLVFLSSPTVIFIVLAFGALGAGLP